MSAPTWSYSYTTNPAGNTLGDQTWGNLYG